MLEKLKNVEDISQFELIERSERHWEKRYDYLEKLLDDLQAKMEFPDCRKFSNDQEYKKALHDYINDMHKTDYYAIQMANISMFLKDLSVIKSKLQVAS